MSGEPDWRRLNRANWDERVAVHLGPGGYDLRDLMAGRGRMRLVENELGPAGQAVAAARLFPARHPADVNAPPLVSPGRIRCDRRQPTEREDKRWPNSAPHPCSR